MIVNSWSISRGRSYELDKNEPGSASITLYDLTGELDPTNGSYPFNPGTPGAITLYNPVTGGESIVFRGFVASFDYDLYQTEDYAVATVELVDGLDRLSRIEMLPGPDWGDGTQFASENQEGDIWYDKDLQVAHRINDILDSAGWPNGQREIFSGNVRLMSVVYPYRTPALTGILDAADAEFPGVANFYIQKTGQATFHGRLARFNPGDAQYHIANWTAGDLSSGANALISSLEYDVDVSRVINSCTATHKGIPEAHIPDQEVENASSVAQYGRRSESFDNLLTLKDYFDNSRARVATKKFATYYVNNYSTPRKRVNTVTFKGLPVGSAKAPGTWALMQGVDISDKVTITTTHHGGAGGISESFYVEGIRMDKGPHELDVEMTLELSPTAYYNTNPWA